MILYIHSHEIEDRGFSMGRHAGARDRVHILVPDGTSVSGIVDLVNARVGDEGTIYTLIFNGHGDDLRTGSIYFGNWIDSSNVGEFAPLRRLMNAHGFGVELHCCRSGSSETMLLKMARAFGVRVTAPLENQVGWSCYEGTPLCIGGETFGRFEGPVVRVYPDGRVFRQRGAGSTIECSAA